MRKIRLIIISVFLGAAFNVNSSYADEAEEKFKQIVTQAGAEFKAQEKIQDAISSGEPVSNEMIKATGEQLRSSLNELKRFITSNSKSIWADDAQFIVARFSTADVKQQALEWEYLLNRYPDFVIEEWTFETLPFISFNTALPSGYVIRVNLAYCYKQLNYDSKLRQLCDEAINLYPDKAYNFQNLLGQDLDGN